jgi:probable F420-dependent oxidoreductase
MPTGRRRRSARRPAATAPDRRAWVDLARRAEQLGYATLTMPDHFDGQLAPVPALMAAADATERLRIGALVWDNDYRHPVVLAKELATLDLLSEGRLQIGIGAGWMRSDYDAAGLPYDRAGVRVDRFVEALSVLKGCFAPGAFSYAGEHYTITDHDALPLPVQRPWPPFLIGAGGKRMLTIAAREADIVGINGTISGGAVDAAVLASMMASAVDEKIAIVREAAGDRFADIELNIRTFFVKVTDDRHGTIEGLARMTGQPAESIAESPFALVGTPAQIADDVRQRRDRWGFSYLIVGAAEMDDMAPVVAELAGR